MEQAAVRHQENVVPHDFSLVLLANDLFENSQPLSEAVILAFDDFNHRPLFHQASQPAPTQPEQGVAFPHPHLLLPSTKRR